MKKSLILIVLIAAMAGCGDRAEVWDAKLKVMGPYKVSGQVMWVDATRGLVLAMSPGTTPRVRAAPIRRNAVFVLPSPTGKELLVLTGGKEARLKGQEAEDAGLSVVRPVKDGKPSVARFYPMTAGFNRLAVDASGKHAVAFHGTGQTSGVFKNPNEVALLDLSKAPGTSNPVLRTLRSFGSAPLGVAFSPHMAAPAPSGAKRTLAVIQAVNQLTLLDMSNPQRAEITVPLAKLEGNATVSPKEVLFSTGTGTIFVRGQGSADVYALRLTTKKPEGAKGNDFSVVINQPSSGKAVEDMVLFTDSGKDVILTANSSQDLSLIDADTSQFSVIKVGEPVDTILAVPANKPTLALVYSRKSPRGRIHFLALADLSKNLEKNLVSRNMAKAVYQLVATAAGDQALVVHNDQRTVISVLDLVGKHHTVSPIQGQLGLGSYDFTKSPYLVGVSSGLSRLGILDLSNLHPRDLRLDHAPKKVLALGDVIVVDHGAPYGMVTVVPGPKAKRKECHVVWGFLLDDMLSRELVD